MRERGIEEQIATYGAALEEATPQVELPSRRTGDAPGRRLAWVAAACVLLIVIGAGVVASRDQDRRDVSVGAAAGATVAPHVPTPGELAAQQYNTLSVTRDGVPVQDAWYVHFALIFMADDSLLVVTRCGVLLGAWSIESGRLAVADIHPPELDGPSDQLCRADDAQWLTDFFTSGPSIFLEGDHLLLRSGTSEVVLQANGEVTCETTTVPAARPAPDADADVDATSEPSTGSDGSCSSVTTADDSG